MEAGLDSIAAVELKNRLTAHFDLDLSATVMFDYPTIVQLAQHVADKLKPIADVATGYGNAPLPAESANSIASSIADMIHQTLNLHVAVDQPLMEAGVDSIGMYNF